MKITIAYPPMRSEKGVPLLSQNRQFQWFHRPTYIYPVVPAYAATMAAKAGHEVCWLDGIAEELSEETFLKKLSAFNPDVILFETKTPVVKRHWQWLKRVKDLLPSAKLALCGDHVTAFPEESFSQCPVDYVLTGGDYDFLLINLLEHLQKGTPIEAGIWFRDGANAVSTGSFVCDHDLASLPHIDRDLSRWELYSVMNGNYRRTPGTYIMAGRDCWHGKCTFCSWTTLYPNYRIRPVEDVINEIGILIEKYGVREIMDDTGTFPTGEWLNDFCNMMIERGYNRKITMDCNMRFGALSFDQFRLMKKAGFRFVLFGLESANQNTLDRLNKNLKVEAISEGARMARKAGLDVHVTVMLGYPWEKIEDIEKTVNFARNILIKGWASTLQVTLIIPYPGTPLFKDLQKNNLLTTDNWDDFDMRTNVIKSGVPEEFIKKSIRQIYKAFLHPQALLNRVLKTRHPMDDLKFYWRGMLSLLGHFRDFR